MTDRKPVDPFEWQGFVGRVNRELEPYYRKRRHKRMLIAGIIIASVVALIVEHSYF